MKTTNKSHTQLQRVRPGMCLCACWDEGRARIKSVWKWLIFSVTSRTFLMISRDLYPRAVVFFCVCYVFHKYITNPRHKQTTSRCCSRVCTVATRESARF
jgi:hypothetical protein